MMWFWVRSLMIVLSIMVPVAMVFRIQRQDSGSFWIRVQLVSALMIEIAGLVMPLHYGMRNTIIYNVYGLLEFGALLGWASHWRSMSTWSALLFFISASVATCAEIAIFGVEHLNMFTITGMALVLVGANIRTLWTQVEFGNQVPIRHQVFLIATAHVFFFASMTTLLAPLVLLSVDDMQTSQLLWLLLQVVAVLRYTLIAYSLTLKVQNDPIA